MEYTFITYPHNLSASPAFVTISDEAGTIAYASGNGKSASIVCILDLNDKVMPPGPPASNVILRSAAIHGLDETQSSKHAQVFIFIDGNTKNPSEYSK